MLVTSPGRNKNVSVEIDIIGSVVAFINCDYPTPKPFYGLISFFFRKKVMHFDRANVQTTNLNS